MTFEEVFLKHGIHPKFWAGIQAMILANAKPDAELQVRIDCVQNYRNCLRDLKLAGTRSAPVKLSPAVIPFQSIDPNDQIDPNNQKEVSNDEPN